jgi:allatostatin receptor
MLTQRNVIVIICITWSIIFLSNIPIFFYLEQTSVGNTNTTDCIDAASLRDPTLLKICLGWFFVFGYIIPRRTQQVESMRIKKHVTKMVVIVVVIFAICWLPFHALFIIDNFTNIENDIFTEVAELVAMCLMYMNSCVNPIMYAFMSDNFWQGFRKLLCCYFKNLRKTNNLRSRKYKLNNSTHL